MDEANNASHLKLLIASTAVIIALVLTLILLLLIQLYCSLRRRHHHTAAAAVQHPPHPSDLCPFYAHGVLRAPRTFLFPAAAADPRLQFHNYNSNLNSDHNLETSPNSSANTADEQVMGMHSISNPIYDEDGGVARKAEAVDGVTPPLTPMKKLPSECPSVSVGTHTDSINAAISSSSSRPSSFTSPSW